jgi:predicted phage terminase large subunit-like protein
VLWPERFGPAFFDDMKRTDPRGFSALYQCRPSPEGGAFFKSEWLREYMPKQLPALTEMRVYMGLDLAVSKEANRDKSCLLAIGVDRHANIWVLPQTVWIHASSDVIVEQLINLIEKVDPMMVWGEKGHIAKSIGPFLRKRMTERNVYAAIEEMHPTTDKQARAQSIMGRMAAGKVRFPVYAPWWPAARDQILKFPHSSRDDFVDALSMIGLGLMRMTTPSARSKQDDDPEGAPKVGTAKWMRWAHNEEQRQLSLGAGAEGW